MSTILDNSHHMPVFIVFDRILPQLITLATIPRVGLILDSSPVFLESAVFSPMSHYHKLSVLFLAIVLF